MNEYSAIILILILIILVVGIIPSGKETGG